MTMPHENKEHGGGSESKDTPADTESKESGAALEPEDDRVADATGGGDDS